MTNQQVNKLSENTCPVCGSKHLIFFFEMLDVPVHCNLLWQSPKTARNCPKGDIKLAFCPVCSFITNLAFEPALLEYSHAYDSSLYFSPYFQEYALSLATRLIERHNLYNKDIIDIGCGKGYFLMLLCNLGNNRGVGFDPGYIEQNNNVNDQVKFIQDFYSEKYSNYKGDLIVCRQVLEHIQNPKSFLNTIRHAIGNQINSDVFFEVPNALQIFQKGFIWDIIYEHCSYFTPTSLSLIFSSCGFQVCELNEEYEGQFFCIDAVPKKGDVPVSDNSQMCVVNRIASDIKSFADNYRIKVESLRHKLKQIEDLGQRIVIWGAGSKGVTFLNTFKKFHIEYAVDINPHKQGMYIPGTGQLIVSPGFLRNYQPDIIIIMNQIYKSEIQAFINKLKINPKLITV